MIPSAVAGNLPEPVLRIPVGPADYRPHFSHAGDRIWPETNCYLDLWIETLHALGLDPVPAFACALSADHDALQWTFLKQQPEDLRRLYGLEVAEDVVWMPLLETIESGPSRGVLHTVEVDSWWLPDTAGTAYHADHVKTSIVPTEVDRELRRMWYIHGAGLHELSGDDFDGVFGLSEGTEIVLPPYTEQITSHPGRIETGALVSITREHLARRAEGNPVERLAAGVDKATEWLPSAGIEVFHAWAFATLRQCGATAEVAADFAACLDTECAGAGGAAEHFLAVSSGAKAVQFKMARVANGRKVDVRPVLDEMADSWQTAMDVISSAAS
ncbi:DUF1839 family protein [Mycobacterium sp. OTB74]|uniref:DUF1839 family protein n=1 Tax=Mycobacterium sp. OTB74 TaxID=1853452 RepID=UPI0024735041|nr:DUF1839 family protein [Mycobacterium sp. OTB74]MDH6242414.1 hypothetical protein [Mycobacterium sp. OTB74]